MSDTNTTLIVHSCPPYRVRAVAAVLRARGLTDDDPDSRQTLHLGEAYMSSDLVGRDVAVLIDDLTQVAPEAAFTVYEDATDEWLGTVDRVVPPLGRFTAATDHDGNAVFTVDEILEFDQLEPGERQARLGIPWVNAIATMPEGAMAEPVPHETEWTPADGRVIVLAAGQDGADVLIEATCLATVDDHGNLETAATADAALAGAGFLRANPWEPLNQTCRKWGTAVYRTPR
ncbi:hypothetical protein DL991_41080 [Amycolatopsis sp. WAC 01375]|uniref:hypothetical protein n=1 Tax=Amycolatopsis sp. WAC 01375 TaxID=2203194 RepID=UPI000F795476|nr:hypothetical protein [Amycolatopsis sp. WAC 01375]RSM68666.1 hypothetical protein DL991_41080 [Amycolatopsis sp. WAC 01375]